MSQLIEYNDKLELQQNQFKELKKNLNDVNQYFKERQHQHEQEKLYHQQKQQQQQAQAQFQNGAEFYPLNTESIFINNPNQFYGQHGHNHHMFGHQPHFIHQPHNNYYYQPTTHHGHFHGHPHSHHG